jgi:hypothetical protein
VARQTMARVRDAVFGAGQLEPAPPAIARTGAGN